jgi:hypothetical protein
MAEEEKILSAEEFGRLSPDVMADWAYSAPRRGYVYRPLSGVINSYFYGLLSEEKRKEFRFDPSSNRYVRHLIVQEKDD